MDVNAGYIFPDQIAPLADATPAFYYNAALTKISGIRTVKGTGKIVYMGVGLEMIQTVAVANDIINRAWHWFMGYNVGISENFLNTSFLDQNVPNPCGSATTIEYTLSSSEHVILVLTDVQGRTVQQILNGTSTAGNHQVNVNTSSLEAGVYYYTMQTASGKMTRKMIVTK